MRRRRAARRAAAGRTATEGRGLFDDGLTRVIRTATQRSANGEAWPWGPIGVVAYLLRRSLRYEEPSQRLRLTPGDEVTISVRDPDG